MLIRLLTYNVHKCIGGLDRRYAPDRVRDTIAHYSPDLVLLQEVDNGCKRSAGHRQVDLLGEMLGYRHRIWYPNVRVRSGGQYGNAILSRFAFTQSRNIDVTVSSKKNRSVIHARYRARSAAANGKTRTVHVFNLHLGLSGPERKLQLKQFLASQPLHRLHKNTPIVVAGDFNDVWGTLGKKILIPAGFRGMRRPLATFPAYAPMRALDSVFVRGDVQLERVQRSGLAVAKSASDHLPLIADLVIS